MSARHTSQFLRACAYVLALTLILGLVLCVRFSQRGGELMQEAEDAFDRGDFEFAVLRAEQAARLFYPGAKHVREGESLLLAVARGAEAEGNFRVARQAWQSLSTVERETDYPGRGESPWEQEASRALERLAQVKKEEQAPLWKTQAQDEDHSALKGPLKDEK